MKAKKDLAERKNGNGGEEFFRAPRAEFLLEELQESPHRQIGDLVTNPLLPGSGRLTIRVEDEAMKGADIRNGDFVVVEKRNSYEEGSILAVQLGNRRFVRRYFRAQKRIYLQGDPSTREVMIVEPHTPGFRILGQVVQIIREIS